MAALTLEITLHLHNLGPVGILDRIRGVDVEMLLDNAAHVLALHVKHLLAPGDAHELALDFEHRCAVGELDAKAIARERQYFFFHDECLGACSEELREDTDGLRGWCEGSHDVQGCVMIVGKEEFEEEEEEADEARNALSMSQTPVSWHINRLLAL